MANHGYVKTKKKVSLAEFEEAIKEIIGRRFNGLLKMTPLDGLKGFLLTTETKLNFGRQMWIASPRKIELRHGGCSVEWWIDTVFSNELALKFDGVITDDADDEKVKPVVDLYPKFFDYYLLPLFTVERDDQNISAVLKSVCSEADLYFNELPGWEVLRGDKLTFEEAKALCQRGKS